MDTLKDTSIGTTVRIVRIHGTGAVRRRIMDMGLTRGCRVVIRKTAPMGDPLQLTVRGYELSLRKDDAAMIEVAPADSLNCAGQNCNGCSGCGCH